VWSVSYHLEIGGEAARSLRIFHGVTSQTSALTSKTNPSFLRDTDLCAQQPEILALS
jgi:hypothetical protein